jgi:hypothetical protein
VIKKEAEKILKYKDLTTEIQRMWKVKTRVDDTSNNRSDWDHFKIIQKIHKQHTRKPCEGTTENSNIPGNHVKELQKTAILGTAHTHTSESANVKVQ